jgi:hypothetical protein
MNSEALALKNGTLASPAVARARRVLPVPGAPASNTPFGARATEAAVLLGGLQEVHDFVDLGLDFVDTGDVVERHAHSLRIDALLFAPAQQSTGHPSLLPPEHPDPESDEEQQRRKRHQQVRKDPALLDQRRGTHDGAAIGQLHQEVVGGEGRPLGRELLIRSLLLAQNRYCLSQLALDRISSREKLGDVLVRDLRLEG